MVFIIVVDGSALSGNPISIRLPFDMPVAVKCRCIPTAKLSANLIYFNTPGRKRRGATGAVRQIAYDRMSLDHGRLFSSVWHDRCCELEPGGREMLRTYADDLVDSHELDPDSDATTSAYSGAFLLIGVL